MFPSHGKNNVGNKVFQKPNILRRKTKISVPKPNISNDNESLKARSLVATHVEKVNISEHLDKITLEGINKPANILKTAWKLTLENNCEDSNVQISQETECSNVAQKANSGKIFDQNILNIESFLNGGGIVQNTTLSDETGENKISQARNKWGYDVTNNSMDIIVNNNRHQELDLEGKLNSVIVVPAAPTSNQPAKQVYDRVACNTTPTETIPVESFSSRPVKLKCDYLNCNKGFWTEEKLNKHKNSHNKQVIRSASQTPIECPVKKVADDGTEEKCPHTFKVRGELVKHLNEDHTLEDANYRCSVCGRRFFWATGLRAHGAAGCARGGLACAWPGCGRVFRLPCRLREHARAHTGDRPYLCRYPDCGWAFRSASKLLRHARRHTDDRAHACPGCARAFRRREHLRDHVVRHHLPSARATHLCTHPGCEQTFTNMSTLYLHMKKVHRKVEKTSAAKNTADQLTTVSEDGGNVYLVSVPQLDVTGEDASTREELSVGAEVEGELSGAGGLSGVATVPGVAGVAGVAGVPGVPGSAGVPRGAGAPGVPGPGPCHAARTHCTWPLARPAHAAYVLDDDVHVERTEGSGSDVYTVRSDLFLHGNVPIDEDSQHMVGAAAGAALEADLCLDAHPSIDLMQEELMYEDAAVDDTSFRVFLMNGEELT